MEKHKVAQTKEKNEHTRKKGKETTSQIRCFQERRLQNERKDNSNCIMDLHQRK